MLNGKYFFCALIWSAAALQGCDGEAVPATQATESKTTPAAQTFQTEPAVDGLKAIDPAPETANESKVTEQQDIQVEGQPACAFIVQYANAIPQPVTWRREPCSAVTANFISRKQLADLSKIERLSAEALADIERSPQQAVFYVESEFTASIFPLNVAGRIYEIPVAD